MHSERPYLSEIGRNHLAKHERIQTVGFLVCSGKIGVSHIGRTHVELQETRRLTPNAVACTQDGIAESVVQRGFVS